MMDLQSIWTKRFGAYVYELQKYLRFVITGHLAIVFIFLIGAGGFAYSEWLQTVEPTFPSILLASVVTSLVLFSSQTATLLHRADAVYLLPLESSLEHYMKNGRSYSTLVQSALPLIVLFIFIPLLSRTTTLTTFDYVLAFLGIIFLKWAFVQGEYYFRRAYHGRFQLVRIIGQLFLAFASVYTLLIGWYIVPLVLGLGYAFSMKYFAKNKPFPWEHMITIEENRMMRFYRFANYFTDVPHVQGSKRRRSYMNLLMTKAFPLKREKTYSFLYSRMLIRIDDMFRLWLRLTVILAIIVYFLDAFIPTLIIISVLTFATAFQLIESLKKEPTFRMDHLFPIHASEKKKAIHSVVFRMQIIQLLIIILVSTFVTDIQNIVLYAIISLVTTLLTSYFSLKGKN